MTALEEYGVGSTGNEWALMAQVERPFPWRVATISHECIL